MDQSALRTYYQRELKILREDGALFAARYPSIAPYLGLGSGVTDDPLVERLLESMAYLTARIRQESEAELPGLAAQILGILCPSLAAPVPSMSVVSFAPDYQALASLASGWEIPAGTKLYGSPDGGRNTVRWRTGWPLTLTPARVTKASSEVSTVLQEFGRKEGEAATLRLRFTGLLGGETLRLFLRGDRFSTFPLHDWVHTSTRGIFLVDDVEKGDRRFKSLTLPRTFLRPAGLDPEDFILPGKEQSWDGFRLLQEYFTCPERFLFWELGPWPDLTAFKSESGTVDLVLLLTDPLPEGIELIPEMFDPAAVPVINLFERWAEPIHLDYRRSSYPLHPDYRRAETTEIHSVVSVKALAGGGRNFPVPHFLDRNRETHEKNTGDLCWKAQLSPAPNEQGSGTTLYLSGGDMAEELTLSARVLCTNRHLATQCGCAELEAEVEIPGRPVLVVPPSSQRDPHWGSDERWRLVSNFAMAQESLCGPEGLSTLQNILHLYVPPGDTFSQRQISGVLGLKTELMFHPLRPSTEHPLGGLVRGLSIDLTLETEAFQGGSPLIFANVLEVFMGLRSALNQLTRLRLFLNTRKGVYHQWPPRSGSRTLL